MWIVLTLLASLGCVQAASGDFELVVLHTGTLVGQLWPVNTDNRACVLSTNCSGGLPKVMNIVQQERAKDGPNRKTLYLLAGATIQGSTIVEAVSVDVYADLINLLNPDAMVMGNHDFRRDPKDFFKYLDRLTVPVLAANVELEAPKGQKHNYTNCTVVTVGKRRIGIVGFLGHSRGKKSRMPAWVAMEDVVYALRRVCAKLARNGTDIIIALGTGYFELDQMVAKDVPQVDLVVGAANKLLYNGDPPYGQRQGPYPIMVQQDSGKRVPVVEVQMRGRYLGRLVLTFNKDGYLGKVQGQPIFMSADMPSHPHAEKKFEDWKLMLTKFRSLALGTTTVLLEGDRNVCCLRECNLGNMITEAIVQHSILYGNESVVWAEAAVAFYPCALIVRGLSTSKTMGVIYRGNLYDTSNYNVDIVSCAVNGRDLRAVLETTVAYYPKIKYQGHFYFLQMSGIRVEYDVNAPMGKRVRSAEVLCAQCPVPEFLPLNDKETYRILAPNYIVNNNPRFNHFHECGLAMQEVGKALDIVVEYLQRQSPVFPEMDDRIVILRDKSGNNTAATLYQRASRVLTHAYTLVTLLINVF